MARIVSFIPSRDGHPRTTRRPINKLYQLEAAQDPITKQDAAESQVEKESVTPTVTTRSSDPCTEIPVKHYL